MAVKGPLVAATTLPFLTRDAYSPSAVDAVPVNVKSPESKPAFEIEEHPIDQVRPIKVGVIGAGLAGITAGVLFPAKLPGLDLKIYDKNADVVRYVPSLEWFENTYPGVRCDIPAHVYQSGFAPNTQWTEEFAQGAEIREYWQGVARKYDVYRHLRLQQKVERAEWIPQLAKWRVTIQDLKNNKVPDLLFIIRLELTRRIALIGNGASGLQVLPSIQPLAHHVDHYARNRTWVADSFGTTGVRRLEPNIIPPEQRETFKDSERYQQYRKSIEQGYFSRFGAIFKNSPENLEQREKWTQLMLGRVIDKPELGDLIIPDFPPNCRRPTPGPGYLEALTKPNVSYIQTPIQRFTAAHLNYLRRDPRWEDWEYTYTNPSGNRFAYFGNGWTTRETMQNADLTPHVLRPEEIDLRSYMEGWWDV
ncbi:uncharacterized protein ATNIH1004_002022 [Aspergillus tanneri]|uniref:FAD/NAD(P)-binding domain-containing protein n=1 Tax=Aspergillus tanneri TaxID=1220188 RepID=A0A5M9M2L6_9EURO|nr:uncharacterized protein ATNIH1004_002022 [Aspergillus tanneri]KAA8641282.1 hypothetical protein ATNIH1004_002022 [Aspergillus tanneri]